MAAAQRLRRLIQVIDHARELPNVGEKVRHVDQRGITFVGFDRKISISAIGAEITQSSVSDCRAADRRSYYAEYLASRSRAVGTVSSRPKKRIQELLEHGPPRASASPRVKMLSFA
ncbi:MAG TPA: hypothetical protein VEG65_07180 [Candidatus Bathyarchaeia archaeon]|nr:hypothetical protein [Candidatus Bathyarchaeia archaeon]